MKKYYLFIIICIATQIHAQLRNDDVWKTDLEQSNIRDVIRVPDIDGYKTLKCDFHVHTIFSDGKVWPDVRVNEAWMQGYDAIAITDHIEYRPHKDYLKGDHNESFKIAQKRADEIKMIVIKGSEITRSKPLGHLNALFLSDANPLDIDDPLHAIDIARKQGAVILWNHPGWPDDKSTLYDVHKALLAEGKIDMVEVHNSTEYYPLAFDWIEKYNLAPSANSDTHSPIMNEYGTIRLNRPITLVFADARSESAIKHALLEKRTAAWFDNKIVAKEEWAKRLFQASVKGVAISEKEGTLTVELENISDIPYLLKQRDGDLITLPPNKIVRTSLKIPGSVTVMNVFIGHNRNLEVELPTK